MSSDVADGPAKDAPWIEVTGSSRLAAWLAERRVSLAFTTYQTGKLFLLGLRPDGGLAVFERTFGRAMGLWADGHTLWLGTQYQVWRFENALRRGETYQGHDRLYVPRLGYTTGDLDAHDVAVDAAGRVVFVATLFNCLATVSVRRSFTPLWRPPFLSKLAAEDRCHLNGLALEAGRPRYVTAVSSRRRARSSRLQRVAGQSAAAGSSDARARTVARCSGGKARGTPRAWPVLQAC